MTHEPVLPVLLSDRYKRRAEDQLRTILSLNEAGYRFSLRRHPPVPPIARQPRQPLFVWSVILLAELRLSVAHVILPRRKHDVERRQ